MHACVDELAQRAVVGVITYIFDQQIAPAAKPKPAVAENTTSPGSGPSCTLRAGITSENPVEPPS